MLLTYFDDSGEGGAFVLAAVIVDERNWHQLLDAWTDYRSWLRRNFGLKVSRRSGRRGPVELHATDIITGSKAWRAIGIGREARIEAYKVALRLIGRHTKVFAVAWLPERPSSDWYRDRGEGPAVECWKTALERLTTYSVKSADNQRVMTFMDSGYEDQFRKVARKMRRYHAVGSMYGGSLSAPAYMLIDDPITKDSRQSVFTQMADLCAYAALREVRASKRVTGLWEELGDGILRDVNKHSRNQPPGIKLLPT